MNEELLGKVHQTDCLPFMRSLPDKCIDLVVTDPPYGIDYNNKKLNRKSSEQFEDIEGDKAGDINFKLLIIELQRIGKRVVIFGAINFFHDLPYKGVWLCWDKRTKVEADAVFGSPFELAWCDKIGGYDKIYRIMHGGVINNDGANAPRFHPTQKPIQLMSRIINDFSKESTDIIFDPFSGSGSTLVAAKQLGRKWLGCEISEAYCKIAEERLRQEYLF
mgnify:CR=1 FL=1